METGEVATISPYIHEDTYGTIWFSPDYRYYDVYVYNGETLVVKTVSRAFGGSPIFNMDGEDYYTYNYALYKFTGDDIVQVGQTSTSSINYQMTSITTFEQETCYIIFYTRSGNSTRGIWKLDKETNKLSDISYPSGYPYGAFFQNDNKDLYFMGNYPSSSTNMGIHIYSIKEGIIKEMISWGYRGYVDACTLEKHGEYLYANIWSQKSSPDASRKSYVLVSKDYETFKEIYEGNGGLAELVFRNGKLNIIEFFITVSSTASSKLVYEYDPNTDELEPTTKYTSYKLGDKDERIYLDNINHIVYDFNRGTSEYITDGNYSLITYIALYSRPTQNCYIASCKENSITRFIYIK